MDAQPPSLAFVVPHPALLKIWKLNKSVVCPFHEIIEGLLSAVQLDTPHTVALRSITFFNKLNGNDITLAVRVKLVWLGQASSSEA